jgi:hypothetical protein
MPRWFPPFNQAQPGWEDGCGFVQATVADQGKQTQSGSQIIPKGADRVTIVFPTPLVAGTSYEISASTENLNTGDPTENIFPTQVVSRNSTDAGEVGFTYLLNSAPTSGTGVMGPSGENSQVQFNWGISYVP